MRLLTSITIMSSPAAITVARVIIMSILASSIDTSMIDAVIIVYRKERNLRTALCREELVV